MEITRRSKLLDVLREYPFLEDKIVSIAPPFKNLRNPVLRRTVGQLATIEQVADIGHLNIAELVNTLRGMVGEPEIPAAEKANSSARSAQASGDPEWIVGEPQAVVDGTELLQEEQVPLTRVNELLRTLEPNRYLLLLTDFEPLPILEEMQKQRRQVYHKTNPADPGQHLTFIR